MTTPEPPRRKAVRPSARSSAGLGGARSNATFATPQPHRSSPTHRPGQHKDASHLCCNAVAPRRANRAADLSCRPPMAKSP
jgi:hypothetical protein